MARTKELEPIETFIRNELAKSYPGHTFTKKSLPLRKKVDGNYAFMEFDAVSDDKSIVAEIKSGSWQTSGRKFPSGKRAQLFQSIYFLSLVDAKTKLLILTDRECYEGFLATSDGKLGDRIEIRSYSLPKELEKIAKKVQRRSSKEMSQGII